MRPSQFVRDVGGNVAIFTALGLTAITGIAGLAVLHSQQNAAATSVQSALDAGVLAGTSMPYGTKDQNRIDAAHAAFERNTNKGSGSFLVELSGKPQFTVSNTRVSGSATGVTRNSLGASLGITEMNFSLGAKAEKIASDLLCVLTMNEQAKESFYVYGGASFEAVNCAVQVNSMSGEGIALDGSKSWASASQFGVSGSYSGHNISPPPLTGSEPVDDPYANLPIPERGTCLNVSGALKKSSFELGPGTYCGGLNIKAGAAVTLQPGLYVVADGQFAVGSGASVAGEEVIIALVGKDSFMYLNAGATVKLTSPVSGTYKNIQIMSDRDLSESKFNEEWSTILSGATLEYDGVLYLPEQQFWVSGTAHDTIVRGYSPDMIMITDAIWVQGNAKIEVEQNDRRNIGTALGPEHFFYGARLVE